MSIFKYTLPSGSNWTVTGPADATQIQADRVFYEQVASGSLVGYNPGQTLSSAESKIIKLELSRADRGTAGVDNAVLSIVADLPETASVPELVDVPLQNPIDDADVLLARGGGLGPNTVGPLTSFQVQKLLAQIANVVDQEFDVISQEKGIGQFGFTAYSLEQAGYVKPGTTAKYFINNPEDFIAVMSSPSVWTGKNGINSLDDILLSADTQSTIQTEIMQQSYNSLVASGVIVDKNLQPPSISTGQVYTNIGLVNRTAISLLGGRINGVPTIGTNIVAGITNKVTGDISALIGNASKYGTQATALWSRSLGIGNVSALQNINLNSVTQNLTNLIPGSLPNLNAGMNLLGKASQFSVNFSNPLSSLNSLSDKVTGQLTGQTTALVGQLQGQASAIAGQLQGQASALQGQAQALASQVQGALGNLGSLFSGGGDLVSGTKAAAGFNNTVNRQTVDAAFKRVLGSNKIPVPNFEAPSIPSVSFGLDIAQAQNILKNIETQASQLQTQAATQTRSLFG
jgi:hypothetical protein